MKHRNWTLGGGILCLLVVLLASHLTPPQRNGEAKVVGVLSAITDANHEHNYLLERATRTALLPEVSYTLTPSTSRTTTGRQRTSASHNTHHTLLNIAPTMGRQTLLSRATRSGYLPTSRTKDFYIFALRHIII